MESFSPSSLGTYCFLVAWSSQEFVPSRATLRGALKPKGRALVCDIDWGTLAWHSASPALMSRVTGAWEGQLANPRVPRTLGAVARRSGLRVDRVECLTMVGTTIDPYVGSVIKLFAGAAAGRDGVTEADVSAWEADLRDVDSRGGTFFSLNQFYFLLKPE